MPLSWNEIKNRAIAFMKEWANESSEDAEAKSFWDSFFYIFGVSRKRIAVFEQSVRKQDGNKGYIDLLWKGVMLVEHKSRGKNLDKAFQQAKDYFPGLKDHELPKYILVSDFAQFRLYNLEENTQHDFLLQDFLQHIHLFGFIAGYEQRSYKEQDPVNIEAAERMGKLHDALKNIGYTGHQLEVYLVRLLFCLFAEDTGIFERTQFQEYIDLHTKDDGSDLAMHLDALFEVLNTPKEERLKTLSESLNQFPYINGKLFEERLKNAAFDTNMRQLLLYACSLDWSKISPAIFGSMFQSVMNPTERRNLGAHYTSEKNIQKVIKPLFLDNLYTEFEKAKGNTHRLQDFHKKLAHLYFLDPACGCGNFLIISYRELRQLELLVLKELHATGQGFLDVSQLIKVDVNQFAGIEYDEFAARIAEVALWLIDHQMNMEVSATFGQYFARLPLKNAATIVHGNALTIDWESVISKDKLSYILGNPPFIGSKLMTENQRKDLLAIFGETQGAGVMDYVSAWYIKAAQYIQNTNIKVAFVSTNSITQGEQVGILWGVMFEYNCKIHFAHRTFNWSNEAKGNAAVHCVIIGFAAFNIDSKYLFHYDTKGDSQLTETKNISPYLINAKDVFITKRTLPICNVPLMKFGNQPIDGGYFIINTKEEYENIIQFEPDIKKYIKKYVGSYEFINKVDRWVFWLKGITPNEIRSSKIITDRIQMVKEFRLQSTRKETFALADYPTMFAFTSHTDSDYIIIPSVSSEKRKYIPIGFLSSDTIASNLCLIIPNASLYLFGILTSFMHVTWVKYVCGRLKSDYRYSNTIVYNNYPFPFAPTENQRKKVEEAAQQVLTIRAQYTDTSLAVLYDSLTMPSDLVKAHQVLDKAVDICYRPQPFTSELNRIEYLFELYEQYSEPLFKEEKKKKGRGKK